jgi:predicted transcriptional regulator
MARTRTASTVLTVRVPREVERRLQHEARRLRKTRSDVARAILEAALTGTVDDPATEARRQSKLAAASLEEAEFLRFVTDAADLRGWK